MSLTYRSVKGSALTSNEVDANFLYLDGKIDEGGLTAGDGIDITSGVVSLSASVAVAYETSFTGDGVTTEFTITHDFFNKNISCSVKDDSYIEVYPKKDTSSIYQVVITFTSAPEDGAVYSVLLIGLVNEEPDVEENALLNDDGVTPLLNDDGVTNLLT